MNRAKRVGDTLWIHKDGRTFSISLTQSSSAGGAKKSANQLGGSGLIRSPMPGKILKIEIQAGKNARVGQTVCVIEAMKMEYALRAPFEGKIKEVYKKPGEQVLLDEKILLIEEGV